MTEQQPYELVRDAGSFELRRYRAHVVAETTVSADFERAGNQAFRYLFGYISGDNTQGQSISMTSPVVQSAPAAAGRSQKIAMTAPVTQRAEGRNFVVAFVLPASMSEATAPIPTRAEVTLRTVPASLAAVMKFSGRWTSSSYDSHRVALLAAVAAAGLTPLGETRFARFDPPYQPWFLRRNEVAVDVAESGS
ncbi:MAG: heme-binding protein [Antricoccus sp.]